MKWGVRRYRNKDGTRTRLGKKRAADENGQDSTQKEKSKKSPRINRDSKKLRETATGYYRRVNQRNMLYDVNDPWFAKNGKTMDKDIADGRRQVLKTIKKLERRYGKGNISAIPKFEENGYVVESVETSIRKLDRMGRITKLVKSYNPVETYNTERKAGMERNKKIESINAKYAEKMKNTKDPEKLSIEWMDALDALDEN